MREAHGGRIVERILDDNSKENLKKDYKKFTLISLDSDKLQEVLNLTLGVFSPLEGFMNEEDYKSVIIRSRLSNDFAWTIPIVLDISAQQASKIAKSDEVVLVFGDEPVALMKIQDIYKFDKTEYSKSVFGTDNQQHPGVKKVFSMEDILIGGALDLIEEPRNQFYRYTLRPKETRVLFKEKGWTDVVGFQTRNVPHLGHEYVQKTALSFVDGLFINPVIGRKKKGDFKDEAILAAYDELIKHYYLRERAVMAVLHTEMRYAGPKEAIHHAIMRKNFGCTHFIVGRDHAGVGSFYDPFAAHEIFDKFPDLGIFPIFFKSFFYCKRCAGIANDKTCPHDENSRINFSGTKIRQDLIDGKVPSEQMMRPEVSKIILTFDNPFVD
ncbi:MAG: sulfate adenylyltransferase [Candidatus Omnitrophica bacterium]|nr:sulfate adenylyltransferase [Candidatus Omnitrophota bacterium]